MSESRTVWHCPNCGETLDRAFASCWICGTTPDGEADPKFVHADDYEPERFVVTLPKYRLGALFLMAASVAGLIALGRARAMALLVVLSLILIVACSLAVTSWLLAWLVRKR